MSVAADGGTVEMASGWRGIAQAMGYYSSSRANQGCVSVSDTNGNITEVRREDVRRLLDTCIEALAQPAGCQCGDRRVEVVEHQNDDTFFPRTGCATCNTWDGPSKLKRP